jgi:lipoprotein-anchoring transpeptidase ErfK/SrfK
LKPGQFTWHPERSPEGPVAIVVSIPDQRVHVYRNGIRIAVSTCSTGKPGHSTPTGVFTILQKDKHHRSSTYNNAPMPNMNRLTWSGIALHAGQLPGYPASHGCVRLPMKFSELLFGITVIIADDHHSPREVAHPGLVLSDYAVKEFATVKAGLNNRGRHEGGDSDETTTPTSVLISRADQSIHILENGQTVAVGTATIQQPDVPFGERVFVLTGQDGDAKGLSWHAISYGRNAGSPDGTEPLDALRRVRGDRQIIAAISDRLKPGLLLVMTDLPSSPDTRTGQDFVVLNEETKA